MAFVRLSLNCIVIVIVIYVTVEASNFKFGIQLGNGEYLAEK